MSLNLKIDDKEVENITKLKININDNENEKETKNNISVKKYLDIKIKFNKIYFNLKYYSWEIVLPFSQQKPKIHPFVRNYLDSHEVLDEQTWFYGGVFTKFALVSFLVSHINFPLSIPFTFTA